MNTYNPHDWYWQRSDGAVFGSARSGQIDDPSMDAAYAAWQSRGNVATVWPRDDDGDETDAALADVLRTYGLSTTRENRLAAYAAEKRRAVVAGGCVVTVAGVDVPTWADAGATGALTGLIVAAQLNPAIQSAWKGRDGQFYGLDASDIAALAAGVMSHVQSAFDTEEQAQAGIDAETITTPEDIDALAWPANDEPPPPSP